MTINIALPPREKEWKHVYVGVKRWTDEQAQDIYKVLYPYAQTNMSKRGYRSIAKDTPLGCMSKNFVDVRERSSLLFSEGNLLDTPVLTRRTDAGSRDLCFKAGKNVEDRVELEMPLLKGGASKARRKLDRKHNGAVSQIFEKVGVHPGELERSDMCDIQRFIFRVGFNVTKEGKILPPRAKASVDSDMIVLTICLDQGDVPYADDHNNWGIAGIMDRESEIEIYDKQDRYEVCNCPLTSKNASAIQIKAAKKKVVRLMGKVVEPELWATREIPTKSKLGRARVIREARERSSKTPRTTKRAFKAA